MFISLPPPDFLAKVLSMVTKLSWFPRDFSSFSFEIPESWVPPSDWADQKFWSPYVSYCFSLTTLLPFGNFKLAGRVEMIS